MAYLMLSDRRARAVPQARRCVGRPPNGGGRKLGALVRCIDRTEPLIGRDQVAENQVEDPVSIKAIGKVVTEHRVGREGLAKHRHRCADAVGPEPANAQLHVAPPQAAAASSYRRRCKDAWARSLLWGR